MRNFESIMFKAIILCVIFASVLLGSQSAEKGFTLLTAENFDSFIEQNPRTFVFFYDNACRHCDFLETALPKIVHELSASYPELKLAEIKKEENAEFVTKQKQINMFPHLRLYSSPDFYSVHSDAMDEKHILGFLTHHLSHTPSIHFIDEDRNFERFKEEDAAIYLSSKTIDEALKELALNLQKTYPEFPVYIGTTDSKVDAELFPNAKSNYRCMFHRKFDDGSKSLTGSAVIPVEQILTMINSYKHPKVANLNSKNYEKLLKHSLSAVILFDSNYDTPSMLSFTAVAQTMNTQGLLLRSKLTEPNSEHLAEILDISPKDFPALRVIRFGVARNHKFKLEGEITEDSIREFMVNYLQKKVPEYYRSEEVPAEGEEIVRKIVALNFDEFTSQKDKDVVVLIESGLSSEESDLALAFEIVAEKLSNKNDISFGKLNADLNDDPHVNIHSLPTIYTYKRGTLAGPRIRYNGEKTPDGIAKFIAYNLHRKFDVSFKSVTDEL